MSWWRRNDAAGEQLAELVARVVAREVGPLLSEIRQGLAALHEAASQAKSIAGAPSDAIVTRLIDANEKLSTRFQELWMSERETAREQRRNARASQLNLQAQRKAAAVSEVAPPPLVIPEAFTACEECMATVEGRAPATNSDLLKHAGHKREFWTWLQSAHGPTSTTPNGAS
jgi:hypothetical protein